MTLHALAARPMALIGARCVGKTSVGRALASALGLGFVDLDDAITWAASEGCCAAHTPTVVQVVENLGWDGFRELESRELARVLSGGERRVLSTGGGAIERESNRRLLRERALCIWLRQAPDVLRERLAADKGLRPSLTGARPEDEIAALLERRKPLYAECAHLALDCGTDSIERLVERIRAALDVR